jgi:hypothetical protein
MPFWQNEPKRRLTYSPAFVAKLALDEGCPIP